MTPDLQDTWKTGLWRQFGAAIDMLENAIVSCPVEVWQDRSRQPEYWYLAYHTLFWLDHYLSESPDGFRPPPPYTLDEMDPAGLLPDRVYSQDEMRAYLEHGREKCRRTIVEMTGEKAARPYRSGSVEMPFGELMLYNMRHVQHHMAQMNLICRLCVDRAPGWVGKTRQPLDEPG